MYRRIQLTPATGGPRGDAEAVFAFEKTKRPPAGYASLDRATGKALSAALRREEFSARTGAVTALYPQRGPKRLYVVGLGAKDKFDGDALRIAMVKLVAAAFDAGVKRLQLTALPGLSGALPESEAGGAIADGLVIGGFAFDRYKGAANRRPSGTGPIDLRVRVDAALRKAVDRGLKIGTGVTTARTLAATPPNVANPRHIAAECRKLARRVGLRCTVIDAARAKRLGMGGLTAVGRAGSTPPVMICLEWTGGDGRASSPAKRGKPILLVGKAITFDTGGYSLKVGGSMKGMKYDKCGGMAVIGAMEALARLKVKQRVVGLIPCAENMIDEDAYRVDDILTCCNGVTVEVTNTDAEGRLVLADALAYGTKHYRPRAVIDLATLTGGVVIALGTVCAGMFCNDDRLRAQLEDAARVTGERLWPLPLWDEYREMMKGTHGDLVNSAPVREAHPIQGAAFLSHFVGEHAPIKMPELPWAHLDIAGVAARETDSPLYPKGPTGFGVRLLAELIAHG